MRTRPLAARPWRGCLRAYTQNAGGDRRSAAALEDEGAPTAAASCASAASTSACDERRGRRAARRASTRNARARALSPRSTTACSRTRRRRRSRVRTTARDRDDYLAHPPRVSGCAVRTRSASPALSGRHVLATCRWSISDGLNANAVNEQLRALLPPVCAGCWRDGRHAGRATSTSSCRTGGCASATRSAAWSAPTSSCTSSASGRAPGSNTALGVPHLRPRSRRARFAGRRRSITPRPRRSAAFTRKASRRVRRGRGDRPHGDARRSSSGRPASRWSRVPDPGVSFCVGTLRTRRTAIA